MDALTSPAWDGARNAADLGGLPLLSGGWTAPGRVWRSAAPEWLTTTGWAAAYGGGVRRVVDLRNAAELGRRDEHPVVDDQVRGRLEVVHAPTEDPDDAGFLAECGPWLDHPRSWAPNLRRFPDLLARVFAAIADAEGGVLIHCAGGRDRTGMVCSMLLALNGVEPDAVAASYEHGFRGAGAHRGHGLAYDVDTGAWQEAADEPWTEEALDAAMADRLPVLRAWLAETDVAAYLRGAGLPAERVTHLGRLLRD